ncbi:MAG: hypothetical protein AAF514_04205 [Verrucomicrobiota bacterium]
MADLLEPLLKSPILPDLLKRAQEVMVRESSAREVFLRELTPDIN